MAGTKGASTAIKSTKASLGAAKQGVQHVANKAGNIEFPNLSPFNMKHQLSPVGPVSYNVVDPFTLRDQWMLSVKKSPDSRGNNSRIYNDTSMGHIFLGELNRRKRAVGYHHESMMGGKIIPETKTPPDKNGVYRAKVVIDGKEKVVPSSFFPKHWNLTEVLKAINEAYDTKKNIRGNKYFGKTSSGITIEMYLDKNNSILTAYPIYEKSR